MAATSDIDTPALPHGTRLLHIGPHKTGTTSLQGALWMARDAMRAQGVRHAGQTRNPSNAVRAVTGQPSPYSDSEPPPITHWHDLVRELGSAREARVVVSSEFFAWAKPDAIRRIVDDVGLARVQIAVTLRPIARIIPSMWQQNVQASAVKPLNTWLNDILNMPPTRASLSFWQLHRHEELIARWADVVGIDRVTAIVVDDSNHSFLLRQFERLLGLRSGTLAVVQDFTNRSLTLPEVEAVRAFNMAFKAEGLSRAVHARMMRFGAAQEMKRRQPAASEPRVELPAWAADRVAEIAEEVVAGIAASGVRVIGDLSLLTMPPSHLTGDEPAEPIAVPPDVAAAMAMGILVASGRAREATVRWGRLQFAEPPELAKLPISQVAIYLGLRARRYVARRWERLRGAVRRS